MKYVKFGLLVVLAALFAFSATGCRAGANGGEVVVVRNGGPFDNKQIKDVLCPASKRKYIGMNSATHGYPASHVQRYFKITSDPSEGADYQGVVSAKSADGFNIHLSGTFYFETRFDCLGKGLELVKRFDKQFGVRKFPDPVGGDDKAPWQGSRGFAAFLNAQILPVIQNELRVAMLKFNCEEVVSSCALVASRGALGINVAKKNGKQTGVNLQRIQTEIESGFEEELVHTFGVQYFTNIKFLMSQPDLDRQIDDAINKSLASFAVISQATAQVQQAQKQAQAAAALSRVYRANPQLAELEKWRIICGVQGGDNKTSGCRNMTILAGTQANVIVGGR